jgi:preprotein translocase subunit SecA
MDELRNGIRLRAYAQHNPVVEYRNEGYDMFNAMSESIREDTAKMMLTVRIIRQEDLERKQVATATAENVGGDGTAPKKKPVKTIKIGRNDPCPCGSGQKWKKCTCKEYHS